MARNFNMTADEMTETGRDMQSLFITHKARFVAFDGGTFNDPFGANWLVALVAAEGVQTAEQRDDVSAQNTVAVEEQMHLCRKKFAEVRYYVKEKAFPTNVKVQDEFGLDDYDDASQSQKKMVSFLDRAYGLANGKYKTQLLAVGYTQPKIDEIKTRKDALVASNTTQNVFVKTEPVDTAARDTTLNAAHAFALKANAASKVEFYDEPLLLNLFLFPRGDESPSAFSVIGNVSQQGTGNLLNNVQVQVMQNGIVRSTNSQGEYGVAGLGADAWTFQFTLVGHEPLTLPLTITDPTTPTVLNAVLVPLP